jgi:MFS family permease
MLNKGDEKTYMAITEAAMPEIGTNGNGANGGDNGHWLAGISRYHWMVFLGCWLGGIFDGMDSTLMSVAGPRAIADLIGTGDALAVGAVNSSVSALFLLGWTLGGVLFGLVGDKLGRVRSMIFSILLYALFTGLAGLAQSWPQLAACRFLTGLGIGGELVSISTFLTEVWPSRSRAIAIGALITSYQAGVFIAGAISTLFHGWREVFFIGALPAVLVVFLRASLKESDRWVEARERQSRERQSRMLQDQTDRRSSGENPLSHWQMLFQKRHARALLVGGLAFGGLLVGYWASLSWIPFWIQDLLRGGGQGNERGIATMYQGVAAVLGCLSAGFIADRIGRRATIGISSLACLGTSLFLFLLHREFSPAIYGGGAALGFFIGVNQAAMYIYLPELFPTLIRASGTGFCLNLGRLVTMVSVFYVGDLMKWLSRLIPHAFAGSVLAGISPYGAAACLFAFAYLVTAAAMLAGEETRGRALPE